MAANYLPYDPQQMLLLPEAIQDWLPEGHLAHFISDTVDQLDLSAFHARYEKGGPRNQPFHPGMMVKVLVYGYATGVFRKEARITNSEDPDAPLQVTYTEREPGLFGRTCTSTPQISLSPALVRIAGRGGYTFRAGDQHSHNPRPHA
jgi:hypothetical protein